MIDLTKGRFIKLTNDKKPLEKFDKNYSYAEIIAADTENVGLLMEQDFLVIDLDIEEEAYSLLHYINEYKINCDVMQTTRGLHFWFRSKESLRLNTGIQNALSFKCDIRCWGKKNFVMVKKNGLWREWIKKVPQLDFIPKELVPLTDKLLNEQPSLLNLKEGEGRRNALFKRIIPLANNGFKQEELKELFKRMNNLFFRPLLTDAELASCFTDNVAIFAHESPHFLKLSFYGPNAKGELTNFLHYKFADYLNKKHHCVFHNGKFYFYDQTVFSADQRLMFVEMNKIIGTLKKAQRLETLNHMETTVGSSITERDDLLNVENGFVNVLTGELLPFTPQYFDLNKINVTYDPNVKTTLIDTFISQLCKKDKELIKVVEEVIGSFIIKNMKVQKAFVLKGYGANGKSTFLEILRNFFGGTNISSVGIEELQERFKRSALVGKLINIAAEMPETSLNNLHMFKKLVTGDVVDAEFKGKDSFNFINRAKFIFSANELPAVNDTSDGFTRRIMVIPFTQYFDEKSRDPDLLEKLITPEQTTALLNVAIRGLHRLVNNNWRFTHSMAVEQEQTKWLTSLNGVIRYLSVYDHNEFLKVPEITSNYQKYVSVAKMQGMKPSQQWKFQEEVLSKFKLLAVEKDKFVLREKDKNENI